MIIRLLWRFLCLFFPWLVLLIHDNPGGALIVLIMQATLIGWIPATIWALRTVHEFQPAFAKKERTKKT